MSPLGGACPTPARDHGLMPRPLPPARPREAPTAVTVAIAALLLGAALLAGGCGAAKPGVPLAIGSTQSLPRSPASHVVVIVMENAEYGEVLGGHAAPYVSGLAARYGLATESFAITHPSLPNYLSLVSGSTLGVSSDCTECEVSAPNIVDRLEAAGISWGAYLEGAPGPCFGGASAGGYAKKHNPFIYFRDISRSPSRCRRLVGFAALAADLRAGRLPTYVWISPNLCDDGHDCGVAAGDRFLARTVPALLRQLGPEGFLVLTWDEGVSDAGCCAGSARGGHIATLIAGPQVRRGARVGAAVDHYGVLATIEGALGLAPLGAAAEAQSGSLAGLFTRAPHIR
jgi:phosphatidylinositol-3-phosphatase